MNVNYFNDNNKMLKNNFYYDYFAFEKSSGKNISKQIFRKIRRMPCFAGT